MAAPTDVLTRIDEIETKLHGLSVELHEIRTVVTQAAVAPVAEPAPPSPVNPPATVPAIPPVDPTARLDAAIGAARLHLSEGERSAALDELERAIEFSRTDPQALRRLESILEGIARYQSSVRARAGELAETAGFAARAVEEGTAPSPSAPRRGLRRPTPPVCPACRSHRLRHRSRRSRP